MNIVLLFLLFLFLFVLVFFKIQTLDDSGSCLGSAYLMYVLAMTKKAVYTKRSNEVSIFNMGSFAFLNYCALGPI